MLRSAALCRNQETPPRFSRLHVGVCDLGAVRRPVRQECRNWWKCKLVLSQPASGNANTSRKRAPDRQGQSATSFLTPTSAGPRPARSASAIRAVGCLPAGENWHPLLGEQTVGNLYLTVTDAGGGAIVLGVAGDVHAAAPGALTATLRARLPIVKLQGTAGNAIAGTSDGPLRAIAAGTFWN
jgi:hypothetical protein